MENKIKLSILPDGTKRWFMNGVIHREDGPAIEYKNGIKRWFMNGILHRLDGPAVEFTTGTKEWYFHGKRHRLDGPAWIHNNGQSDWYINDYYVTKEIYSWAKENNIDLDNLTDVDKALIKIVWSNYEE